MLLVVADIDTPCIQDPEQEKAQCCIIQLSPMGTYELIIVNMYHKVIIKTLWIHRMTRLLAWVSLLTEMKESEVLEG